MKQKGTKNLTFTQRLQIETLMNAKQPKQKIADIVGINIRTLYYELKKGKYEHLIKHETFWYGADYKKEIRYSAQIAQERYNNVCTKKGRPLKVGNDYEFVRYIENRVKRFLHVQFLEKLKKKNCLLKQISVKQHCIDIYILESLKILFWKKGKKNIKKLLLNEHQKEFLSRKDLMKLIVV